MKVLTVWIHVLCCVTNCHKLITLKQYKRIVLLSSWLRRPGSGSPGPRPGFSQAEIRVLSEPRTSPTLPGCWRDPVPGAFRAENVSSAHRGRHHSLSRGFRQHGRLLLQSQTDSTQNPRSSCNEVPGVGREKHATSRDLPRGSGTPSPAGAQPLAWHIHGQVHGAQQPCTSTEGSEEGREF